MNYLSIPPEGRDSPGLAGRIPPRPKGGDSPGLAGRIHILLYSLFHITHGERPTEGWDVAGYTYYPGGDTPPLGDITPDNQWLGWGYIIIL